MYRFDLVIINSERLRKKNVTDHFYEKTPRPFLPKMCCSLKIIIAMLFLATVLPRSKLLYNVSILNETVRPTKFYSAQKHAQDYLQFST